MAGRGTFSQRFTKSICGGVARQGFRDASHQDLTFADGNGGRMCSLQPLICHMHDRERMGYVRIIGAPVDKTGHIHGR